MIQEVAEKLAEVWNAQWPVGTDVMIIKDRGDDVRTKTTSQAYLMLRPGDGFDVLVDVQKPKSEKAFSDCQPFVLSRIILSRIIPLNRSGEDQS